MANGRVIRRHRHVAAITIRADAQSALLRPRHAFGRRALRIAQVAPPFQSVPPLGYGGTERVVSLLTEELIRRGHDVTLYASGDSQTAARLVPTVDTALWRTNDVREPLPFLTATASLAFRAAARGDFDIVHSHLDFHGFTGASLVKTPTVTTLHGRLDLPELPYLYSQFPDVSVVSISESQRLALPQARWAGTVYNAVDVDRLQYHPNGGRYLAWLGRISPDKGLDRAIRIARLAGLPLKIGARLPLEDLADPSVRADWDYYRERVKPLLREPGIEFVGEVAERDKAEFLGNALALLNPITWPEPFGLVMAEALACGTPVIARRRGAAPEVVTHGLTGLIGDSDEEIAGLCGHVQQMSRAACRREAVRRFSPQVMVDGYEAIYRAFAGALPGATERGTPDAPPRTNGLRREAFAR